LTLFDEAMGIRSGDISMPRIPSKGDSRNLEALPVRRIAQTPTLPSKCRPGTAHTATDLPIRVTAISAERSDRTSSSRSRVHAPNSALSAGDRDCRPVGQGEEVVYGVLDWHRREPEHSADRRGHAFPGVDGRAHGHPPALSIPGLTLTSSTCGRRSLPECDRRFDLDR
jgi:hypothetical protein